MWACVRTLVPQGSGASAWAGAPAWAPVTSPPPPAPGSLPSFCPAQAPPRCALLGRDTWEWTGEMAFPVCGQLGEMKSVLHTPRPRGSFQGVPPQGLPSFTLRDTGCGEGFCRLLGLALPEWLETALLCPQDPKGWSAPHGCMASPQPRLENGSPAQQTPSHSCVLVWFFKVANVGFVLMLNGSARSPEPSAPRVPQTHLGFLEQSCRALAVAPRGARVLSGSLLFPQSARPPWTPPVFLAIFSCLTKTSFAETPN